MTTSKPPSPPATSPNPPSQIRARSNFGTARDPSWKSRRNRNGRFSRHWTSPSRMTGTAEREPGTRRLNGVILYLKEHIHTITNHFYVYVIFPEHSRNGGSVWCYHYFLISHVKKESSTLQVDLPNSGLRRTFSSRHSFCVNCSQLLHQWLTS